MWRDGCISNVLNVYLIRVDGPSYRRDGVSRFANQHNRPFKFHKRRSENTYDLYVECICKGDNIIKIVRRDGNNITL